MWDVLLKLTSGDLAVVITLACFLAFSGVVSVTIVIAQNWRKHYQGEMATTVVLEMLERGMSADEIKGVLKAMGMEDQEGRVVLRLKRRGQSSRPSRAAT